MAFLAVEEEVVDKLLRVLLEVLRSTHRGAVARVRVAGDAAGQLLHDGNLGGRQGAHADGSLAHRQGNSSKQQPQHSSCTRRTGMSMMAPSIAKSPTVVARLVRNTARPCEPRRALRAASPATVDYCSSCSDAAASGPRCVRRGRRQREGRRPPASPPGGGVAGGGPAAAGTEG